MREGAQRDFSATLSVGGYNGVLDSNSLGQLDVQLALEQVNLV